jgi:starch phosphorylase
VFSGKAHPADRPGQEVLRQVHEAAFDGDLKNRVVFVEDYDINVGRHLVQGVDVWLNNPRRPQEASGTSGQKVLLNGGLNFSVLDGWWGEAYDGLNGFAIGDGITHVNHEEQDRRDASSLYDTLENQIIPLYYQRDDHGLPRGWVERMKRTIRTLGWRFNTDRMVIDYANSCYLPAAGAKSSQMR